MAALLIGLLLCWPWQTAGRRLYWPDQLQIVTNDSTLHTSKEWLAGVLGNLSRRRADYAIVAFAVHDQICYTKLRIPQTVNRTQLIENILLYYLTMADEQERCQERLLIYPYFVSVKQRPFVLARYQEGGVIHIHFHSWPFVPPPGKPSRLEMQIYNFVLNRYFQTNLNLDTIPEEIFKQAAQKFERNSREIREIYQRVFLWTRQQ